MIRLIVVDAAKLALQPIQALRERFQQLEIEALSMDDIRRSPTTLQRLAVKVQAVVVMQHNYEEVKALCGEMSDVVCLGTVTS